MQSLDIVSDCQIERTPRVLQLEGLFDIAPTRVSSTTISVTMPINDKEWSIGLIVGPSGSGKTTVARKIFGADVIGEMEWLENRSVIDAFPSSMGIRDITGILSSVGFSSPPAWMRPFRALSTGEQFRVTTARALAESSDITVMDEFTSVVDRRVAKIGSAAVAKSVRRAGKRFVAVSCHYDIIEWLNPDWIFEPASNSFQWRQLQPRPGIDIRIARAQVDAWRIFKRHHYLSDSIHRAASCFIAYIEDEPAAFVAVLSFPHASRSGWKEHRTVCLPDFQGVGIGNAVAEFVASMYRAKGKPYFSTTSHPGVIFNRAKSSRWDMKRKPGLVSRNGRTSAIKAMSSTLSTDRFTAGFEYVGPVNKAAALTLGVIKGDASA